MKNYRVGDNALRRDRSSLVSDYEYDEDFVKGLVDFEYKYLLEENQNEQSQLVDDMKADLKEQSDFKGNFNRPQKISKKIRRKTPGSYTLNK